ncbi:hypothetical protein PIECOFPK_02180 [Mycovorax composti]|uniref:Uncharacterized protein n=1 Tax=Mycovorax composti TaxID=2962693 RepID=A0ABZ2ELM3_9BACT
MYYAALFILNKQKAADSTLPAAFILQRFRAYPQRLGLYTP